MIDYQKCGFIAYKLPGENDHYLCAIESIKEIDGIEDWEPYDFILSPFDKEKKDSYYFKYKSVVVNESIPNVTIQNGVFNDISKGQYIQSCQSLINNLRAGDLSKVVLSRTQSIMTSAIDLNNLFIRMKDSYLDAFVYLLYHPQLGTWAAASPELLLSSNSTITKTVALAGTREYNGVSNKIWGNKEIEEHRYIERFINESLEELSINYNKSDTMTQRAGDVEHIKSIYEIDLADYNFINIADKLHPGPAISGYPISKAIDTIKQIEAHDRLFYCGYLGPLNHEGNKYLYINLRCMSIFNNGCKLYVGGGITKDSIPENEWRETELKAKTLSDILLSVDYEDHQ